MRELESVPSCQFQDASHLIVHSWVKRRVEVEWTTPSSSGFCLIMIRHSMAPVRLGSTLFETPSTRCPLGIGSRWEFFHDRTLDLACVRYRPKIWRESEREREREIERLLVMPISIDFAISPRGTTNIFKRPWIQSSALLFIFCGSELIRVLTLLDAAMQRVQEWHEWFINLADAIIDERANGEKRLQAMKQVMSQTHKPSMPLYASRSVGCWLGHGHATPDSSSR